MVDKMSHHYFILTIFWYIRAVHAVVPEYCTQPFNRGDCGLKPVPVFKYYKPGSRCEIDYWRGCPTANKFPDVYNCTLTCIFKMSNFIDDTANDCQTPLNRDCKCDEPLKHKIVYTYANGACYETIWRGCPCGNRFDTKAECVAACVDDNWDAKLKALKLEQLLEIDNILETITETPLKAITETPLKAITDAPANDAVKSGSISSESESQEQSSERDTTTSDKKSEDDNTSGNNNSSESNEQTSDSDGNISKTNNEVDNTSGNNNSIQSNEQTSDSDMNSKTKNEVDKISSTEPPANTNDESGGDDGDSGKDATEIVVLTS